jgi:hypothetical protein
MWSHLSKTETNQHAFWYPKPTDLKTFFKEFIDQETFNLHELVPENEFKFFIDFDYKNDSEYLPDDIIIYIKHILDKFVGSTSLMAINKHDFKTGIHFIYSEKIVNKNEARTIVENIQKAVPEIGQYIDAIPYDRMIRTIYSVKCVGETDYYVPCTGQRDAETMVQYSIYIH